MAEQLQDDPAFTDTEAKPKGYVSERGGFEINANPKVNPPYARELVDVDTVAEGFAHESLAEKFGEDAASQKIGEMIKALTPGSSTTMLLSQSGANGMMLVHVWFGPNLQLFRHSHPKFGDCLYYVVAGEIKMGNRKLGRGSTFFVPNGQPYKYTAGPAGVELLEFRAGGGDSEAPGMKIDETSLDAIQQMIDVGYENDSLWEAPERMGDTTLLQAEIEAKAKAKPRAKSKSKPKIGA